MGVGAVQSSVVFCRDGAAQRNERNEQEGFRSKEGGAGARASRYAKEHKQLGIDTEQAGQLRSDRGKKSANAVVEEKGAGARAPKYAVERILSCMPS